MLNKDDLQAIAELLQPINKRLDSMQEDITAIKEDIKEMKFEVGALYEWQEMQDSTIKKLKEAQ